MSILWIGLLLFGPVLWFVFNAFLLNGWWKMPVYVPLHANQQLTISVLIPVRNEAENIIALLEDLDRQSYPADRYEVIVADDHSTDRTAELVRAFQSKARYSLTLLTLTEENHSSPKKRAISQAIQQAKHAWIVTTDGDCRVGPQWLQILASYQQTTQAQLISGPVTFHDEGSLRSRIQIVEFASLVGSAAVAMFWKKPNMCNGANLSYARSAFLAVDGFQGNENLASGDDEFLMHKIAARFPGEVHFLKNSLALVHTGAHQSFRSFYHQRRRWASKWRHYTDWKVSALAIFVFMANASTIVGLGAYLAGSISGFVLASILGLKFSLEFLFLAGVLHFLKQSKSIAYIPFVQLIYPFYVCFFGLLAQGKGYQWKGRKLQ